MKKIEISSVIAIVLLAPSLVWAHPQHGGAGFFAGFVHPFLGLDHLLAMIAVGIWATQMGARAMWAIPAAFVAAMAAGGMLGFAGVMFPMVEPLVAATVLALGLLVTIGVRVSLACGASLAAVFALFHGATHVTEAPARVSLVAYGTGVVIATALLFLAGIFAALATRSRETVLRVIAASIALTGMWLLVARIS